MKDNQMPTKIVSFGYKHAHTFPSDARVLDVRAYMPWNPHSMKGLRELTGKDPEIRAFFGQINGTPWALHKITEEIKDWYGTVYLGCTGGRHRSVYAAEEIGKRLGVPVEHLDI